MSYERLIKRYAAYYTGWCVAFGEHDIVPDQEQREINWIFGEGKVGITLSPQLKRRFIRELLGHHEQLPQILLGENQVQLNQWSYPLHHPTDREHLAEFKAFCHESKEIHMFMTSHFCYPKGTRIITFGQKKPLLIIYKEISPLKLLIN